MPDVTPFRMTGGKEDSPLLEFQSEIVQLATTLSGDDYLSNLSSITIKEADGYVNVAISTFFQAIKEAIYLGADESKIVDLRY